MAEVVKVPVVGNVKKPWLYAGGAAVAGIAGYAWWTRGAVVEDEAVDVELPATEYEPPTVVDSGISTGGQQVAEPIARTNVEWRSMAAEQGAALGGSDALINSALTKYLGKQRLTIAEAALMSAIVAILGQPPTGGPYSIIEEGPAPAPSAMPAPTGIRASYVGPGTSAGNAKMRVTWNPVEGAANYVVEHVGGSTNTISNTSFDTISARGRPDTWRIRARGFQGQLGSVGSITFTAPAVSGGTGGQVKPTPPARVSARAIGGGRAAISWVGATGGPGSYYEIRSRGIVGIWKRVNGTSYTSGPWRRGARLSFEVRTRNRLGVSAGRVSNPIVIT